MSSPLYISCKFRFDSKTITYIVKGYLFIGFNSNRVQPGKHTYSHTYKAFYIFLESPYFSPKLMSVQLQVLHPKALHRILFYTQ